jgi:hypothetical protein
MAAPATRPLSALTPPRPRIRLVGKEWREERRELRGGGAGWGQDGDGRVSRAPPLCRSFSARVGKTTVPEVGEDGVVVLQARGAPAGDLADSWWWGRGGFES